MSVKRGIICSISVHTVVHLRERYCFSLVCTCKKAIKNFKVKVDVREGALKYGEKQLAMKRNWF